MERIAPDLDTLVSTLAGAMGVPLPLAESTAVVLRKSGLLPPPSAGLAPPVTAEHAVHMFLALMLSPGVEALADPVRLYAQLPFDCLKAHESFPDGRLNCLPLSATNETDEDRIVLGDTFGAFLTRAIEGPDPWPDLPLELGSILASAGLGTVSAKVIVYGTGNAAHYSFAVSFSLAPLGGGVRPDDAPIARVDQSCAVPGEIFPIMCGLFAEHRATNINCREKVASWDIS